MQRSLDAHVAPRIEGSSPMTWMDPWESWGVFWNQLFCHNQSEEFRYLKGPCKKMLFPTHPGCNRFRNRFVSKKILSKIRVLFEKSTTLCLSGLDELCTPSATYLKCLLANRKILPVSLIFLVDFSWLCNFSWLFDVSWFLRIFLLIFHDFFDFSWIF